MSQSNDIDIVITWVDDHDPVWLENRKKYGGQFHNCQYRDWNLLRFWFRGIKENLSWIRMIHFVTAGQIPAWLNTEHPKIHIVQHKDFIPENFLPTFSSHVIEIFMHLIPGLSEEFIYANDDMFIMKHMDKEDFFRNGLPCDCPLISPVTENRSRFMGYIALNNLAAIHRNFCFQECVSSNMDKWFASSYPDLVKERIHTSLTWENIPGFFDHHMVQPYRKQTFAQVWKKEYVELFRTAGHRFRTLTDLNPYLFRYWHLMSGEFFPKYEPSIKYIQLHHSNEELTDVVTSGEYKMICLNDSLQEFSIVEKQEVLSDAFLEIFPQKSAFELNYP